MLPHFSTVFDNQWPLNGTHGALITILVAIYEHLLALNYDKNGIYCILIGIYYPLSQ